LGKGFKPVGYFFAVLVTIMLAQSASAVSYFYPTQSFECTIYEGGGQMFVSQAATLYAFEGFVEVINVTLPYGEEEMVDAADTTVVRTTAAKDMDFRTIQNETHTIFEVTLPEKIYAGDDFVVILRYYIYDIAGDAGISRVGEKTLGDQILGRTGENTLAAFSTPVFEATVNELIVKIFPPLDYIPKDWEPPLDAAKSYDPATGRVAILWHLTSNVPTEATFEILFGKPGWGVTAFIVIGALVVVFLYLTVDMMNRLKEKAERGELW
jgi:hypothetical protein